MVMTRMPPMRARVGVPPQSGKPGLRLAAALRTARGRGARSVRRTRRLRAGQCSAKSVWTAVLEGAAAGGNDLWRGGACGAVRCVWAAPGRPRAAPSPPSFTSPSRSRPHATGARQSGRQRPPPTHCAPTPPCLQHQSPRCSTATITSTPPPAHRPPRPQFSDQTVDAARRDGSPPSGSTRSCRTCRRTRRCPARPDRSATTSSMAVDDHGAGARSPPPPACSAAASAQRRSALMADPLTARAAAPAPAEGLAVRERHLLPQHPLPHRLPI